MAINMHFRPFRKNFNEMLEENGFDQKKFSEGIGWNHQVVNRVLGGDRPMHLPALLEAAADHRFIPSTKRLLTLLSHLPAYACNAELKISLIARVSKAHENNGSQQIADKKCVFEVDEYTHIHQTRMSKALNHLLTTYGTPAFTKIIKEEIDKNNIEENARIVENAEAVIRDQSK